MKKDAVLRYGLVALLLLSTYVRADEPRILIPKNDPSTEKTPRSSYNSLSENRGTFKWVKGQKEQQEQDDKEQNTTQQPPEKTEGPIINFNNVTITEVLKYVSRLTGKNFVYDPQELQFAVTVISDHPNSVEEVMAMILQALRIHGYLVMEEGSSYIIHTNPTVKSANALNEHNGIAGPQLATQVFVLQNIGADQCAAVVKAMISDSALVEAIGGSHLIVSDITENIRRISDVIRQIDSQKGALEIGQYVAINASPGTLVSLSDRLLSPIAGDKPLVLVPHMGSNSVFIVSTPQMIERTLSVMQTIDLNMTKSGMLSSDQKFDPDAADRAMRAKAKGIQGGAGAGTTEENLSDEEIRRLLLEQGVDPSLIDSLTVNATKDLLSKTQRRSFAESELPIGSIESTQFYIYRLQYRKSSDVANALRAIATSLTSGTQGGVRSSVNDLSQSDLVITLNSLQPVDDNNTIVFTGTGASLQKARELLSQIDTPVRQVFIEALILDTTLANSLQFGVEWEGKIKRTNFGAEVGFRDPNAPAFGNAMDLIQQTTPAQVSPPPAPGGFSTGAIGRKIKFRGKGFRSTGALVTALHTDNETHIIMNPKILTEHNVPAEVFVGSQTPIKGQSIANSTSGSPSAIVATNYNTVNTGIDLKVTPLISSSQTVTLIIEQTVSNANAQQVAQQGQTNAPPATINETRTTTRVHMPSDHFLVISGMIQESSTLSGNNIPCLGALPVIGSLFGTKLQSYATRNIMIFIRPIIVDTEIDIDQITNREEQLTKEKAKVQQGLGKEIDDMKSLLNLQGWGK